MRALLPVSVRGLLLVVAAIIALPSTAIIVYSGVRSGDAALDDARRETQILSDRIATEQVILTMGSEQLMTALSQLPEVKQRTGGRLEPILRRLLTINPMFSNIFVADSKGEVWASAVPTPAPFNVYHRRYFQNVLARRQFSSGEYVVSLATAKPAFNLAYPVHDAPGKPTGVISVGFVLERYRQLVAQLQLPHGTSYVLGDHRKVVLSGSPDMAHCVGRCCPELFATARAGGLGFFGALMPGRSERIVSLRELRLPGEETPYMYVAAGIPVHAVVHGALRGVLFWVLLLFCFLGSAVGVALRIGKLQIADRVQLLEQAALRLAGGELDLAPISGMVRGGELGRLATCFDQMAHRLNLRQGELRESRQRLMTVISKAPMVLFSLDREGRFTLAEGRGLAVLGLSADPGQGLRGLHAYREALSVDEGVRRALAGGSYHTVRAIGERTFEVWYAPLEEDGGSVSGTIGVATDVTDRQRAQEEQHKLVSIVEMSRDCIGVASLDRRISYLNRAALALLGLTTLDEAREKSLFDFFASPSLRQACERIYPAVMTQEYCSCVSRFRNFRTGAEIEVEVTCFLIRDAQGAPLCVAMVTRDLTEHRRAEETLRQSEMRMSMALACADLAVFNQDRELRYTWIFNPQLGYRAEEVIGRTDAELLPAEATAQVEAVKRAVLESGNGREEEIGFEREGKPHFFYLKVEPLTDEAGNLMGIIGASKDVTAHRFLESQLFQSQKLESIGHLAAGVAHDFNNLLTPIIGYAELLGRRFPAGSVEQNQVNCILNAADRSRVLVQQLLSFGRKQVLDMRICDLNQIVASFYGILRRTVRENIAIQLHLAPESYRIKADPNRIEQILMNLVVNAQDAIAGKGVITIETAPVLLDGESLMQHTVVQAGEYLMLVVTDTGQGMDQETISHIFEPFYSTKGPGKGTGLGLATVYGLVKQHHGYIWAFSEVGRKTVFKLYFPCTDQEAQPEVRVEEEKEPEIDPRRRSVLLVEDEIAIRTLLYQVLSAQGFQVSAPDDSKQAARLGRETVIDLLVSDVVMPGMDGPELYRNLLESHQGLKVLYLSGYTDQVVTDHGVSGEAGSFLQKPFTIKEFLNKVNLLLSR